MPNFHALAVFEAYGSSNEEIQEAVSSLFASLSHQRVRYYEHEMSEGPNGAASTRDTLHCMVFVDCDVDAYTEEKAVDFANDALDHLSTPDCQYLALGLVPGRPRVQRKREEHKNDDVDEGSRRKRGTRSRARKRREEPKDAQYAAEEEGRVPSAADDG